MSDGRMVIADRYEEGEFFLTAKFPDSDEVLDTTIPNEHLAPDGAFILRPPV